MFRNKVMRRWVQAAVYLVSAGVCFYGTIYGTGHGVTARLVALLTLVIVGFMVAAVWQLLLGIRASVQAQQAAVVAPGEVSKPVVSAPLPGSTSPATVQEMALRRPSAPEVVAPVRVGRSGDG